MKPRAFISSLSTEHSELRNRLFQEFGDAVWVAEHSAPWLSGKKDLEIVDTCMDFIQESQSFVCVFAGRRGSSIRIGSLLANATHFEAELFHAALLAKRIHVFVAKGYEPDPSLRGIFDVLESTVDPKHWNYQLSDEQILARVETVISGSSGNAGNKVFRRLAGRLYQIRGSSELRHGTSLTEFFAGDSLIDNELVPNLDLVEIIISSLRQDTNQRKQLSRIYIALREVLTQPFDDVECLVYRNRLLGEWAKAASWYGLHGCVRSGVLAAAQSMAIARERLRSVRYGADDADSVSYPGAVLASALYSISKNLPRQQKDSALREALVHLERSLGEPGAKKDNLIAIRGSVFFQLGLLQNAVPDYEDVLRAREKGNMGPSKIGEAMTELGFAYLRQGRIRRALVYLEEGVKLLRSEQNYTFLIRGMRKLAIAYAANLRPMRAWALRKEQRMLARKCGAYDQL